jgi:hypothetical protein
VTNDDTTSTGGDGQPAELGLELITTLCGSGTCPTVYRTNRGTLVVQGYAVSAQAGVDLPEGELLVEIPAELLTAAVQAAP